MWSMDTRVELKVLRDLNCLVYGVQWRISYYGVCFAMFIWLIISTSKVEM